MEQKTELWRAVFQLKEWHFIARGEFPNVSPYIARNASIANRDGAIANGDGHRDRCWATARGWTSRR